ncbi:putative nonribosomal peptide synthase [Aspergillus unguis]
MKYSTALISAEYARAILDSLVHLFERILGKLDDNNNDNESGLEFLGIHSSGLIAHWNTPDLQQVPQACIHTLVLRECQKQPNADALCAWDGTMTYSELDRRSGHLTTRLVSLGVRSETVVPLLFEKSMWTVVAILGVLRAGGAFTLLDPSQPDMRLKEICATIGANTMVASRSLSSRARRLSPMVVSLPDGPDVTDNMATPPATSTTMDGKNAAYISFTSGSTGKPKAIVIEHQSFCANALAQNKHQNLNRHTRAFQFASYGFDSSILEMLMTLIGGGCVCIPSDTQRLNSLAAAVNKLGANWLELTPSVARILTPELVPNVRSLLLVGEPLSQEHIATWTGKVQLINAYGPAECSVVATIQPNVKADDPLNIGRCASGHCWIVHPSDHCQLQPIGAPGELLISGPLVGRGYLNYSGPQAHIKPPPWSSWFGVPPTERFYRTGDIVCYNIDDGTLRYIGRKDQQVKLHGQRIELQEVEHHAQQYSESVVVVADIVQPDANPSGAMLTLFVALDRVQALSPGQDQGDLLAPLDGQTDALFKGMQAWLSERLPSYMVPTKFVSMHRFPLTSTGKLDRKALVTLASQSPISPQDSAPMLSEEPVETSEIEDTILCLFSEVLGVPKSHIGIEDTFFSLGGTSLRAIELVACARSKNLVITAADVMSLQTVTGLARAASRCEEVADIPPFGLVNGESQLSFAKTQCQVDDYEIEDIYPCTPLQAGMMSLSMRIPSSLVGTFTFTLPNSIDINRLKLSWERVVSANPILRTRVIDCDHKFFQVVTKGINLWGASCREDKCAPMGLGDRLLRLALIERGGHAQGSLITIQIHHAIFDAWSFRQILEEVETVYTGGPQPERASFKHVISYIGNIDGQAAKRFWTTEFAGYKGVAFPTRSASQRLASRLPRSQSRHMPFSAVDNDWTVASKIKLAWAIVLSSHTNTYDNVFGLTVSGRTAPIQGIDGITGPTIATVPYRIHLEPAQSIGDELLRLHDHEMHLIDFEHSGLPCISQSSAEAAAACGFHNLLTIRLRSMRKKGGIMVDIPANEDEEQKFNTYPLSIIAQLRDDFLELKALFDESVMGAYQVQLMLEHFETILDRLLRCPPTYIGDLMALCTPDRTRLTAWNERKCLPKHEFVHDIIEAHAASMPDSEAVCSWDGSFNYHELCQLAHSLAVHLQSQGAMAETWLPVAMLGILMSGAAFVCLEPGFPANRLQSICQDVDMKILISSLTFRGKCSQLVENIITLADDSVALSNPNNYQPIALMPQNAAYVAFTSGSTGTPKGVTMDHAMLNLTIHGHRELCGLSRLSRGLSFSSLAFDMSILEVIFLLAAGGCICIPSEAQRVNNLAGTMTDMRVNWSMLTPTVARTFTPSEVPTLQTLVLGGEPTSESDIATWALRVNLHIAYGPAECTMLTTGAVHVTTGHDPANVGYAPNASCWIVHPDNHHQLQPVGSAGELVIAGPIIGRGYLNRPKETETAFIHHPKWEADFPFVQGGRFYKTGDLAFHNPDGSLSIIGRKDSQVKLHGQRIELHEIEHCANAYNNGTTSIAALVKFEHLKGPRIVLFTCADRTADIRRSAEAISQDPTCLFAPPSDQDLCHSRELKEHMSQTLPNFMVPSVLIPLRYLPLSPSGKANRKELQELARRLTKGQVEKYMGMGVSKRQPTCAEETMVRRAFASVLSAEEDTIGLDDDFFALGGDSISAMQLLSLCRKGGLSLTMPEFLSHMTVSRFCDKARSVSKSSRSGPVSLAVESMGSGSDAVSSSSSLTHQQWEKLHSQLGLHNVGAIEDIYPCSDAHSGMLEIYTSQYRGNLILAIESARLISPAQVVAAWNRVVQRHTCLRTVILPHPCNGKQYLHVVLRNALSKVLVLPFGINILQEMRSVVPFSCETSPPHRLVIGQDDSGKVLIKLETARAVIDAMSVPVLLEDLSRALQGCLSPDTETPYSHYLSYLQSQPQDTTRQYWEKTLTGIRPCQFPRSGESNMAPEPRFLRSILPLESLDKLDAFWRSHHLTAANVFQLAWGLVLQRYTGSPDVCFGTIVSGRDVPLPQIWQMIGPFFNILPCRLLLEPAQTVLEILRLNQENLQHRNEHQHCSIPEAIRRAGWDIRGNQQLFNTVLTVQTSLGYTTFDDISFKLVELDDATEYDMCIAVLLSPDCIEVELRYWNSTFCDSYGAEVLDFFVRALAQIIDHAQDPINLINCKQASEGHAVGI